MNVAILADTHDNIWKLQSALEQMESAACFIHCGDLCSPFMLRCLMEAAGQRPVHIVWGNNDGDVRLMCQIASGSPAIHLHGALAELTLGGLKVAVNHYPEIARPLAASGRYDLVCYGHDHTAFEGKSGTCILLNPGELMGLYGRTTFAWFETTHRTVRFVEV